ncbi:hypothetical protein CCACVL1_00318 [Corchorus capsularis]|uniref:Uncharacterized protein n=1 Tax=Corchorus capsularis TaxID=210143 RepID=A0A1R3KX74_COCAP|nr:hypothetical protein CCACVL1_00318 [Corchorus capsularis]
MGKGRAPCCDKDKVKRGPWSPAEDLRLITFIQKHGHDNWRALPRLADESKESSLTSSSSSSSITSSCGKRNLETEVEDQWDNIGTVTKKPCREEFVPATNQDFKPELSKQFSSSSISSDNSNMTNSSQVDVPNPENHQAGSLFDFVESLYDGRNISEEVNKPEMSDHTAFDIPFESDLEFWNMLDSLGSLIQADGTQLQNVEGNQYGSNVGEDQISKELAAENNKWLHYLENEVLGVEVTKDIENHNNLSKDAAEPLVSEMYDLLLKPEAEMGMGHYLNQIQSSDS